MRNQELAFRLLAFVWAGCFAQPQEREMVLKIEKCNQKTHNIGTYVTPHLAEGCFEGNWH